ncbi:MAG TPA: IS200/IS605 family transposase [Candidatus Kapabacteria bacterium]|nr:IS200/IS605 family transposase [Candidatus Kapabacteria bacterium]
MANTYTQIHIQIVFAVQGRQNIIPTAHKDELYKYISGIVRNDGHKLLAIGGMPDHIHILVGFRPDMALSDFVRDIKAHSSKFINEKHWFPGKFAWQNGYGAFSYSASHVNNVIDYIRNQEQHHAKSTFREEYMKLLEAFNVAYDEKYVFEWIE